MAEASRPLLEIIKPLGHGVSGITYLAKYKENSVVVKKSYLSFYDSVNLSSPFNTLLKFSNNFASKNKKHFVVVMGYNIVKNPSWNFEEELEKFEGKKPVIKTHHDKFSCLSLIMTPVLDDTLKNWHNSLMVNVKNNKAETCKQIYSFLVQFFYMFYLLQNAGWYHLDAKWKNIMYKSVDEDTVSINLGSNEKILIPSYGKRWYLIDYDTVCQQGNKTLSIRKHYFLVRILEFLLVQPFWVTIAKNKIKIDRDHIIADKIRRNIKTSYLNNLLPQIEKTESDTINQCLLALCVMLEPTEYFNILGLTGKSWEQDLSSTINDQYMPAEDFLFIIANLNDAKKIIEYLASKC